jgi:hypothetical protein
MRLGVEVAHVHKALDALDELLANGRAEGMEAGVEEEEKLGGGDALRSQLRHGVVEEHAD